MRFSLYSSILPYLDPFYPVRLWVFGFPSNIICSPRPSCPNQIHIERTFHWVPACGLRSALSRHPFLCEVLHTKHEVSQSEMRVWNTFCLWVLSLDRYYFSASISLVRLVMLVERRLIFLEMPRGSGRFNSGGIFSLAFIFYFGKLITDKNKVFLIWMITINSAEIKNNRIIVEIISVFLCGRVIGVVDIEENDADEPDHEESVVS